MRVLLSDTDRPGRCIRRAHAVSIRQHTSAWTLHTACVSMHTACVSIQIGLDAAYVGMRQHTSSAYVSIRQSALAYVLLGDTDRPRRL